ncbi:MlaD family protein [[Mycobacterium] nativiensis]|uniref:MlaD family protein n=1 Tax=[Mycobacterium] nativiensis TaxID=2855503 RepID=A0ABU5XW22_9MYCO|nr:MlaD family protein [Mycolicibacter sp. MYC340]MEB3031987.1 MlaD family protein [Mycolicibacter sp. MYC340]
MSLVIRCAAATLGVALIATGCGLDPTRLPVPGAYVPDNAYTVKIEFSSVLNVPARAKVDFGGVQVGVLDGVQLAGSTAVATVDIAGTVELPRNTRAELRQATVLGDIYIALLPPDEQSAAVLGDGDTIPLRNTAPADNIEDVLRSTSNLVSGGTIGTLQQAVIDLNKAFPKDPGQLTRIQHTLSGVLNDLATNQHTINGILSSLETISNSLVANTDTFDRLVTEGPRKLEGLSSVTLSIIELLIDFEDLGRGGGELVAPIAPDIIQILSYITPFVGSVATVDTTIPVIADKVVALVRDKLVPFFGKGGPRYTVTDLHPPTGREGVDPADKTDAAVEAMRAMGLLP